MQKINPKFVVTSVTFEDRRKLNFDKGQAELERRRQQLQEQMRKENEARMEKERQEQEKKEKQRWVGGECEGRCEEGGGARWETEIRASVVGIFKLGFLC